MNYKIFLILFLTSILSSCSFNKMFLHPTKVPLEATGLTLKTQTDSTLVNFDPVSHQPTFLKNGIDTLNLDFTIESVIFTNANGDKLNGWLLKPKDKIATITLLHFHGNAGFLLSQYKAMAPLLKYGFQIFIFDYSGFGFSEGKATRKNVLIDANSAISYIKTRPDIKNTKLIIYGQSLGGHLAVVVASQRQSEIDGLVIEGAFSSHKDIAANTASIFGRILVSEKYSAFKSIKSYKKPILIIHSTEDETIPFEMGKKLFDNANSPKEFYEIKQCHICGPRFYAKEIAEKIKNMINED